MYGGIARTVSGRDNQPAGVGDICQGTPLDVRSMREIAYDSVIELRAHAESNLGGLRQRGAGLRTQSQQRRRQPGGGYPVVQMDANTGSIFRVIAGVVRGDMDKKIVNDRIREPAGGRANG